MTLRTLEKRLDKLESKRSAGDAAIIVTMEPTDTPADIEAKERRITEHGQRYPHGYVLIIDCKPTKCR